MANEDAAKSAKELAEVSRQLDLALTSNNDNFNRMMEIFETLGPEIEKANGDLDSLASKYGTSTDKLREVNNLTNTSIENRLLEGNIVKARSHKELQEIVEKMKKLEDLDKSGKIHLSNLQKAMIRGHKFELEMNKLKIQKMAASEGGFLKMMTVRWLEAQEKIQEGLHRTLGITLKTGSKTAAAVGTMTAVGLGLMVAMKSFEKFAKTLNEVSDASLLAGGYQRRNGIEQALYASSFTKQISDAAGASMTFKQATDAVNMASREGAVALIRMGLEQHSNAISQSEIVSRMIQSSVELQKASVGIFGTTDAYPQVIKAAKNFRLNLVGETQGMLGQIYQLGTKSGVHMQSLMNIIGITGEKAFMTNQNIMETIGAMTAIENSFSGLTKNAAEKEALFDALGKAIQGFDVLKYMAVAPGAGGDIGAAYGTALDKGPIQSLSAYINKLAGQIGGPNVAEKLALAIPEFKQMGKPGVELMRAFTSKDFQDKISGVKTQEQFRKALISTGKVTEEVANVGAARMFIEDPTEKILDVVTKMQGIMLDGFSTVIMAIPGIGDGNKKLALQIKNQKLEDTSKGKKMSGGLNQ